MGQCCEWLAQEGDGVNSLHAPGLALGLVRFAPAKIAFQGTLFTLRIWREPAHFSNHIGIQVEPSSSGVLQSSLGTQATRNFECISRVVTGNFRCEERGIERPGEHSATEVHSAKVIEVRGHYHRSASWKIAQYDGAAYAQSFEGTASFGEHQIVIVENTFRMAHLSLKARADRRQHQALHSAGLMDRGVLLPRITENKSSAGG